MNDSIFSRNSFIIQRNAPDDKETLLIVDQNMKPLCYVKHEHSWKRPKELPLAVGGMRTTDARLEDTDGSLLGTITEVPVGLLRVVRKWLINDEKNVFKGAVKEKPKFMSSDWLLENVEGNIVATIKGDRKKHNYEILTTDMYKQVIARCLAKNESSYELEVVFSSFDPFLILCYVIVLDLVKTATVMSDSSL